jgi:hypothetical protein
MKIGAAVAGRCKIAAGGTTMKTGWWLLLSALAFSAAARDGFDQRRTLFADRLRAEFVAADKDGSGSLSKEEAAAMPFAAQRFADLDANQDGEITWAEVGGYVERAKAAREAGFEQRRQAMLNRGAPAPVPGAMAP